MIQGHLDAVHSSGFVEGWAWDPFARAEPLAISVVDVSGIEIAWGLAHRYRADLAEARVGLGWCAFRLRASCSARRLAGAYLVLKDRITSAEIHIQLRTPYIEDHEILPNSLQKLIEQDPTVISGVDQLTGCSELFSDYIRKNGTKSFVRAVYLYMLNRPADALGLSLYASKIRKAEMSPLDILHVLANSAEFLAQARALSSPWAEQFPFRL